MNTMAATLFKSCVSPATIDARFMLERVVDGAPAFTLDVDLSIPSSGITAIFGHSGSGKTSLLRCIAGLEKAQQGELRVNGQLWQCAKSFIPTHRRPLGYVFQEASLFPHLSAQGNLQYAIKRASYPLDQTLYERVIEVMGIRHILTRRPDRLSGGERQRVAIARALLIQPQLLLMDEPLASLDLARKLEILPYLERLHASFDIPILYVSHSMDEVTRLADYAVVMDGGKVIAQGGLTDVFSRIDLPTRFDQDAGVILEGSVVEQDTRWHLSRIAIGGGDVWIGDEGDTLGQSTRIRVLARDVSLALDCPEHSSILNRLHVEVIEIDDDASRATTLVRLKAGQDFLLARVTRKSLDYLDIHVGKRLWAQIKSVAVVR